MRAIRGSAAVWKPAVLRNRSLLCLLALGMGFTAGSGAVLAHGSAKVVTSATAMESTSATESSAAYAQTAAIGQAVDMDGTLQVLHEDYYDGSGRYHYFLEANDERFELHFQGAPTGLLTGAPVSVKGLRADHAIAVESGARDVRKRLGMGVELKALALSGTFGAQKTVVMLVNFSNNPVQPYTAATARNVVFTTTSNFDLENSYGQTSLTGDVVGWYTIPLSSTVCDYSTLASQARAAATAAGVILANYNRYVYAFPDNACSWWGLGTVGGNPSSAWINGSLQLAVVGHEMGHNFGLYHSHALECGAASIGTGCTSLEYGDALDIMGGSSYHFNAFQKERLGWLNYGSSPPITTVTASGTYSLESYESPGTNPKALKIAIGTTGGYYYVELRRAIGFDAGLSSNSNVMNGVVIHQAAPLYPDSSELLDMTAGTASWSDPALTVGQTFTDAAAQITITPVTVGGSTASVAVTFGTAVCARSNPSIALSPSPSTAVPPGTTVAFTATVTNRDTANCGGSTFDLSDAVPAGWSGTLSSAALVVAAGASGTTTLQVTSPVSAVSGSSTVNATAKNRGATSYLASATATYVVASPTCTRANPSVTLSPSPSASVPAGTTVAFTATVTNRDSSACAASTFDMTDSVLTGWSATLTATALALSPGASGTSTLQVTSATTAGASPYAVNATAKNHGATAYLASATATYVVAAPTATCTRANPSVTLSPSPSAGVAAGTTVAFTATVTNRDSSACTASTFDMRNSVPTGWSAVLSATSLALSPGASGTTTLQVTSAATAGNGSYPVSATAKNHGATSYVASGSATYVVSNPSSGTAGSFTDNFNRADSTTTIGSTWATGAGKFVIGSNMLKNAAQAGTAVAVVTGLTGPTQTAGADFTSVDNNLGPRFGIVLRYQDSRNYYLIYRQTGGSSRLLISKFVNGVETILGTASLANPAKGVPFHITGRISGTTLSLDFNGVLDKVRVTDSAGTFTSGKAGILIGPGGSSTTQQQADNFSATVQ